LEKWAKFFRTIKKEQSINVQNLNNNNNNTQDDIYSAVIMSRKSLREFTRLKHSTYT